MKFKDKKRVAIFLEPEVTEQVETLRFVLEHKTKNTTYEFLLKFAIAEMAQARIEKKD